MAADTLTLGGGRRGPESESDLVAFDFPAMKKYRREDGSELPVVEGRPVDVESHSPFNKDVWEGVFQMCEIRVLKLDREVSAKICGKIYLEYQYGIWELYNRKKEDAENIDLPGVITLTPPTFGVMPYDPLFITFEMENELEEVNEESIMWMPLSGSNEVVTYTLGEEKCSMEVSFIVFRNAVLADMVIDFFNIDNGEGIYGSISVSFSNTMSCVGSLSMFNKESSDPVRVQAEKPILLSRPFVALPCNNGLNISVNLRTVSGAPIAGGIIDIWPESLGKWVGILGGKHGEIQVRATVEFRPYHQHAPTLAREYVEYNFSC